MNIAGKIHQTSKYPPDYLKTLTQTYQDQDYALEQIAAIFPKSLTSDTSDLQEFRLLKSQDRLLELAATSTPSTLEDITDIFNLWHIAAIKDVAPEDISVTDQLILTIYKNMAPLAPK